MKQQTETSSPPKMSQRMFPMNFIDVLSVIKPAQFTIKVPEYETEHGNSLYAPAGMCLRSGKPHLAEQSADYYKVRDICHANK